MSHKIDLTQPAIIGASEDEREKVRDRVTQRCELCRAKVYLSRCMLDEAREHCRACGTRGVVLCWKCAQPWLDDVARRGGDVVAGNERLVDRVMENIARSRENQVRAN